MSDRDETTPMDDRTAAEAAEETPGARGGPRAEADAASSNGTARDGNQQDREMTLEEQLQAERSKAAEYLENWQRSHADFTNYRRRTENERAEMVAFANVTLITKLLPALDDFDLALANVPAEQRESSWVQGVELIRRKMQRILENEGVTAIEAANQPFDPHQHEAVSVDEDATGEHYVVAELRKGYRLRDKVLRPALVRVGNAPDTAATS